MTFRVMMLSCFAAAVWVSASQATQHAQAFGQRCQTQRGWCSLSAPLPVGTPCFCPVPGGSMSGTVVQ